MDVVAFSYYMNNAWRRAPENHGSYSGSDRCKFDPKQTAAFMVEPASAHIVELGESLGKPVQLIAGAPCTYNKEGTGYGAVGVVVVAKQGVRVFARQTLVGAVYGLLGTTTHKHKLAPTPATGRGPPQGPDGAVAWSRRLLCLRPLLCARRFSDRHQFTLTLPEHGTSSTLYGVACENARARRAVGRAVCVSYII